MRRPARWCAPRLITGAALLVRRAARGANRVRSRARLAKAEQKRTAGRLARGAVRRNPVRPAGLGRKLKTKTGAGRTRTPVQARAARGAAITNLAPAATTRPTIYDTAGRRKWCWRGRAPRAV